MDKAVEVTSAKVIFYTIKLIHPKYHPIWFILYMYLVYFRIAKRKVLYHLRPVPNKLIADILGKRYFDDVNNTVAVNKQNLYSDDRVLLLFAEGSNFYRPVYVVPSENCKEDEVLLSYTLYHNLTNVIGCEKFVPIRLLSYQQNFIQFAEEINISLINSPDDVPHAVIDAVLEQFFRIPKIVKAEDVLEINIKYYAPSIFYRNSKINHVESVYFKINCLKIQNVKKDNLYFCAIGQTEIKQSPNIQSYLPKRFHRRCYFTTEEKVLREVPLCPYGLQDHLKELEKSVKPFCCKSMYTLQLLSFLWLLMFILLYID